MNYNVVSGHNGVNPIFLWKRKWKFVQRTDPFDQRILKIIEKDEKSLLDRISTEKPKTSSWGNLTANQTPGNAICYSTKAAAARSPAIGVCYCHFILIVSDTSYTCLRVFLYI